jgi:hypothetical protein
VILCSKCALSTCKEEQRPKNKGSDYPLILCSKCAAILKNGLKTYVLLQLRLSKNPVSKMCLREMVIV